MKFVIAGCLVWCLGLFNSTSAVVVAEVGETPSVNSKIQKLKKRAEQLHKKLAVLEQDLLYPKSSQLAIYVSLKSVSFDMDSVELVINGKRVSNYLYTDEQVDAFNQGGIQQLYVDNIAAGYLDVTLKVSGTQQGKRVFHKEVSQRFHKNDTGLALELVIDQASDKSELNTTIVMR